MVRERPAVKPPHCNICDHDHSGPCTECPDCNKPKKRSVAEIQRQLTQGQKTVIDARDPHYILSERVDALEKRLDAIDSRRKYQREYMRERRKK